MLHDPASRALDRRGALFDNSAMGDLLRTEGLVERPLALSFEDLAALPGQIPDLAAEIPGREGGGVRLDAVLKASGARGDARFITLATDDGSFSASIPLAPIRAQGIVVYRDGGGRGGGGPLPEAKGGPVRFFIKDIELCSLGAGEADRCANVKHLRRIELSAALAKDTRPSTQPEHEALHEASPSPEGPRPALILTPTLSFSPLEKERGQALPPPP